MLPCRQMWDKYGQIRSLQENDVLGLVVQALEHFKARGATMNFGDTGVLHEGGWSLGKEVQCAKNFGFLKTSTDLPNACFA